MGEALRRTDFHFLDNKTSVGRMEVSISRERLERAVDEAADSFSCDDSYMSRRFHCPESYARAENWIPDVQEHTFATSILPLTGPQAKAIMRYREELKLRAMARDQDRLAAGEVVTSANGSLHSPCFLDQMYEFIWNDWPLEPETAQWHSHLMEVQDAL